MDLINGYKKKSAIGMKIILSKLRYPVRCRNHPGNGGFACRAGGLVVLSCVFFFFGDVLLMNKFL